MGADAEDRQTPSPPVVDLSLRDARRIALAAQGFGDRRPAGRVDRRHFRRVLDRVATIQLDSVNVLTRSHELVFFSRLGRYDRSALERWLWSSGEVLEYWGHEASLHPVDRHPLLRWRMDRGHAWARVRDIARTAPAAVAATREAVIEHGPVGIGRLHELLDDGRRGQSWWGWSTTKLAVEHLFWKGEVTATRRNGFARAYMAPERWLPARVLEEQAPDPDVAQTALLLRAARSAGVGTARDLADYFRMPVKVAAPLLDRLVAEGALLPARVEGWQRPAFLHPEARRPRRPVRGRALLSPFDSLVWCRPRTERLWGFRYRIEIYVPAAQRVHGYYVLPFLLDEHLVARVDLKADRREGVLRVRAAWGEEDARIPEIERVAGELSGALVEMAGWLDLDGGVTVEPRGDLAGPLAAAMGR